MSERDRFSLIGHAEMPLMNALRADELVQLLDAAAIGEGEHVLDVGGGRADLARIAVERYRCRATSIDRSPAACESAADRTRGMAIEIVCADARGYVAHAPPSHALAAALGAVHAFGTGVDGWRAAIDALGAIARNVLVADLVAVGSHAATEMDVATMDEVRPLLAPARARIVLGPERVRDYEAAWCAAVERFLHAHPGDPRSAWAEERIAWSRASSRERAWSELVFVAAVLPGRERTAR